MQTMSDTDTTPVRFHAAIDGGYDIRIGTDVQGDQVGEMYWDPQGDGGLVLRLDARETLPDSADEVLADLQAGGYSPADGADDVREAVVRLTQTS